MQWNNKQLKALMLTHGYRGTIDELAGILKISYPSALRRFNLGSFTLAETILLARHFKLDRDGFIRVFIQNNLEDF